jgi:hypothetical protein
VEDLFQPGKMEPVYRGSDIAAICFSVSAMVAVKKRPQSPGMEVEFTVLPVDGYVCGSLLPCWKWYSSARVYRVVRLSFKRSLRLEVLR